MIGGGNFKFSNYQSSNKEHSETSSISTSRIHNSKKAHGVSGSHKSNNESITVNY